MLSVSNSMPLRSEMGPKCCHPILTFIFITLKTKTAAGKGSRILSVVAKCKEQLKTAPERQ